MHRHWLLSAFAILLSIVLAACATVTTQQPQTKVENTTDATNTNSQQLPKGSAKRVVALSSLAADIISQLDQTKLLELLGANYFRMSQDSRIFPVLVKVKIRQI